MTAVVLAVVGVVVSAYTRLTGVVGHVQFSVPVLAVAAAVVVLGAVTALLAVAWVLVRDGLRLRPGAVA